jgi:hypothetical protein
LRGVPVVAKWGSDGDGMEHAATWTNMSPKCHTVPKRFGGVFNQVTSCLCGSLPQRETPQKCLESTVPVEHWSLAHSVFDTSPRFASKSTSWSESTHLSIHIQVQAHKR